MADMVYCEWIKLKRSKILLIGVLGSFIVPFLVTVNHIRICLSDPTKFLSLTGIYEDTILFLMLLFGPLVMAVVATFLISREYTEKTLKTVFAVPMRRWQFLAGKFITLFLLVELFMLLSFLDIVVISLLCGLFFDVMPINILTVIHILIQMLKGGVLLSATLTPFVYLALRARGALAPFIVIAAVSLLNVVLSGSPLAGYYPWTASWLLLAGRTSQSGNAPFPGLLIIVLVCASGICASFVRFQREDIA